ncbi:MAG: FlgD immunoglobulin-like domain containing protein, partial [bacterium]
DEETRFDLVLDANVNDFNHAAALLSWQAQTGPNLTAVITSQRVLQLTPRPDWFGIENCRLIVADPAGARDTANVKIVVNNVQDRPTAPALLDPIAGVAVRSLNPVLRWRAATDVDGDKLLYTIVYSTSPTLTTGNDTLRTESTAIRMPRFLARDTRYYWRATASDGRTTPATSGIESFFVTNDAVGVAQREQAPADFALEQNYPNPFSLALPAATTQIRFALPQPARVSVCIYNALGQTVRALFDGARSVGIHQLLWDGRNDRGQRVSSGLYWLRLESEAFVATKKMVVMP